MKLTTHWYVTSRLRMNGTVTSYPVISQCALSGDKTVFHFVYTHAQVKRTNIAKLPIHKANKWWAVPVRLQWFLLRQLQLSNFGRGFYLDRWLLGNTACFLHTKQEVAQKIKKGRGERVAVVTTQRILLQNSKKGNIKLT